METEELLQVAKEIAALLAKRNLSFGEAKHVLRFAQDIMEDYKLVI